jgi:hypothetical protein
MPKNQTGRRGFQNGDQSPVGDDYLAERCEEYETARAVCLAFASRRFPAGTLVILPQALGGWAGVVVGVEAGESISLRVERRAGGGVVLRTECVSVADALRVNPRQGGPLSGGGRS